MDLSDTMITLRLDGIRDAQKRTRFAFLACIVAAVAVLVALWNSYFSWNLSLFKDNNLPAETMRAETLKQEIHAWVDSQVVSISLLGIRIDSSDLAVLGSATLFIVSFWLFYSIRRENHSIGTLLLESQTCDEQHRSMIYHGISAYTVFNTITLNDQPIRRLDTSEHDEGGEIFLRPILYGLFFLPCIATFMIIVCDFLSLGFLAYFHSGTAPLWEHIKNDNQLLSKLVFIELWALITCYLTGKLCAKVISFEHATGQILRLYRASLSAPHIEANLTPSARTTYKETQPGS